MKPDEVVEQIEGGGGGAPPPEPQEPVSLRDTLEQAFDQHEAKEGEEAPPDAEKEGKRQLSEPTKKDRNEKGQFAKGTKKPGEEAADETPVTEEGVEPDAAAKAAKEALAAKGKEQTPAQKEKAPQSWTPLERESWAKGDLEGIKKATLRREGEISRAMQESAGAKNYADAWVRTVGPFEAMIRAEGSEPFTAVKTLLTTSAAMRTAPVQTRAQLIANMAKIFLPGEVGQVAEMLDRALCTAYGIPIEGGPAKAGDVGQGGQQYHDPRFDAFLSQLNEHRSQKQQTELQAVQQEWEKFVETHEFADRLHMEIGDLIETRKARGIDLSYEDAYKLACKMDDEVSQVLAQRAAETKARTDPATDKARKAAKSVRATPAGSGVNAQPETGSVRSALSAAMDKHGYVD